jgi:putative salt-induced outer membrane protein
MLAVAACIACTSSAFAQTKPDGLWRGTGGAALAITSGNSEASSLALSADGAVATASDKLSLGGAYNYGKSKVAGVSTTNTDKWNGFGEYDYNLNPKLFVFGKLGLEGDKLSDLDLRATVASGLGYKLVDTKEVMVNLFGGVAYSADKYSKRQIIGSSTDTRFSRTSLFVGEESAYQLSASTSFKQRLEFYPGLSGDKAKIAKFTAGLAVAMSSTLNLTVGLTDNYNSAPPAGGKKNDLGIFSGISVKLGSL